MAYTDFLEDSNPTADELSHAAALGARQAYLGFGNNALPASRAPRPAAAPKIKAVPPHDPLSHPDYKAATAARKIAHDNEMYAHQALQDFDRGEGAQLKWNPGSKGPDALPGDPLVMNPKPGLQQQLMQSVKDAPGSAANVQATRQMQLLAEKRQRIADEAERTAKARVSYDQQTFLPLRQRLLSQPPPTAPGSVGAPNFTQSWVPAIDRAQAQRPPATASSPAPEIAPSEEFRAAADTPPDPRDAAPDDVLGGPEDIPGDIPDDVLDPATRDQEQVNRTEQLRERSPGIPAARTPQKPFPWSPTAEEMSLDKPTVGFGDQEGSLFTVPRLPNTPESNPVATGLVNALGRGLSGLTSPKNVAIGAVAAPLGAAAAAGSTIAKLGSGALSTYFAADMAKAAGGEAGQASVDINDPNLTTQQKVESLAAPVISGGMAALAGLHGGETAMKLAERKGVSVPAAASETAPAEPAPAAEPAAEPITPAEPTPAEPAAATPAPAPAPEVVAPTVPALDPERFDVPDENGWALERESGKYFNPQENLWHNPETGETLSSENSTEPTGDTANEHAQREPIEPSGSQPSADGPIADQGPSDLVLGEPNSRSLQPGEMQPDPNGSGVEPLGVPGEAREPSDAGRGIDSDGRSPDAERTSGDTGSSAAGQQPDESQPTEVVGRDAGLTPDGQSLSGSDSTGSPSAFDYRETAAADLPEGHAEDLAAFQTAENTERTQRGEAPITLQPQTLIGGKLGAELGIEPGEAGTAEASKVHAALEKATGKKIVFVKGSDKLGWEAATLPGKPNTILVNTEAARPFASLTGHEIGHHIKNQRPELYKPFSDAVTKALPIPEAYSARRLAQGYTEEQLGDEWVNDQLGKHFNDPKFWEKMRDNTPRSTFQKIVEAVRDHLGNLGEKIKGLITGKAAEPLARDFAKMRDHAANMLRQYAEEGETKPAEATKLEKASPGGPDEDSDPSGIKNAAVDEALDEMGLPPATHGEGKTFREATQQARKIVKADASAGANLINELENKVRAPTAVENLVLDHELVKLRNSVKAAYGELDKAAASESGEGTESARLKLDAAQQAYQRAADVATKAGTASAHSLAFRKAMLKEDFSLAELTRREAATQPRGKPISDLQRVELAELADKYEQASKAYENHLKVLQEENSKYAVDKAINDLILADERRLATRKAAPERELEILNHEADAAEARLAAKMAARRGTPAQKTPGLQFAKEGEAEANIYDNPEDLRDLAIAAARAKSKRLNPAEELVKRFGPEVTPLLPKILAASDSARAAMKHRAITEQLPKKAPNGEASKPGTIKTLKEHMADGRDLGPEALSRYARKLAEQHIAAGVRGRDNVVKAVHESLKEAMPEVTRREVQDAISMYGQHKSLNKDPIKVHLRDVAGQLQNVSKLEDMAGGKAPAKTGVERRTPSDEERRLIKEVEAAKKKGGYTVTDPAKQLKSAIDARATRLQNQIKDLDFQIKTGRKIVRNNVALPVDKEAAGLIKQRDALKKQYDAMFPKPGRTDAQRIEAAMKSADKEIESVKADINSGAYLTRVKSAKAPTSLELDAKRAELDTLRAQREALRRMAKPDPTAAEVAARDLAHLKAHLLNRISEGKSRLAADDVGPRTRTPKEVKLDNDARVLQAENERVKKQINTRFREREEAARPRWVKALDFGARFVRGAVLSSPVTFAKLLAATVQQGLIHPLDEMAGSIIKHAVPKIAGKAQIEGSGFSAKQTARSIASGIVDGWKDAKDTLSKSKGNQSDLDATYGKGGHAAGALEFFGLMHGAEKAFLKRGAFTYAMEKQVKYAMDHGLDYKDPAVQMRMGVEAYKYANRKIFQEDNAVSNFFKRGLGSLTENDLTTGRQSKLNMLGHAAIRTALPVAKVGTNIVLQTFGRAFGALQGGAEIAGAYARGIENLKPEEADMIMRHLKQGSVGGAIALAAYFMPQVLGGQYEPGEKRKPNDVKAGEINIGTKLPKWVSPTGNIPEYLLHNPAIAAAQLGASIGRIANSPERRGATEAKGLTQGAIGGLLGLAAETPYIKEAVDATKAFKLDERVHWAGGFVQSAVPQAVQFAARKTDTNATGAPNTRTPTTLVEHVKQGIPGLRQQVPLKSYVDPVLDRKLGATGLTIPAPSRPRVGPKGKDRAATDPEFTRFKQTFGTEMNQLLQKNMQLILSEKPDRAEQRIRMLSERAHIKARTEMELAARHRKAGVP